MKREVAVRRKAVRRSRWMRGGAFPSAQHRSRLLSAHPRSDCLRCEISAREGHGCTKLYQDELQFSTGKTPPSHLAPDCTKLYQDELQFASGKVPSSHLSRDCVKYISVLQQTIYAHVCPVAGGHVVIALPYPRGRSLEASRLTHTRCAFLTRDHQSA
jgi:hypothetical protein